MGPILAFDKSFLEMLSPEEVANRSTLRRPLLTDATSSGSFPECVGDRFFTV
jgi:hypothetical protein